MKQKVLLWVVYALSCSPVTFAATSALVPINDWTYSALEKLAVCGFADPGPLSSKPLTRIQVAKIIAEAIDHIQNEDILFSAFEDTKGLELLVDGLMEEYQKELTQLGVTVAEIPESKAPQKRLRIQVPESFHLEKIMAGFGKGRSLLIENREGWRLQKGLNLRGETTLSGQWDDWLTVVLTPTLRLAKTDTNLLMQQLYMETEWKNLRFIFGRQSFWWGPGRHGALVLSNNSFGLDALRISSYESYQMPGFLKKLGHWRTDFFLATLGAEQSIKHPKFSGLRQEWSPTRWLSLGGSHTVIFGGEGVRGFDGFDLFDAFFKSESGDPNETENHLAGFDWKLSIPVMNQWIPLTRGLEIYGEYSFEDAGFDLNLVTLSVAVSHLHGLYLADFLKVRDLDLRVELSQVDAGAYEHFFYKTGYRHKGEFLGHHAGPDSINFYLQITKKLSDILPHEEDITVGVEWDLEQSGMEKQPLSQTLSELSFSFSRPGPWGLLLKAALSVIQWKNFDHKTSPLQTEWLFSLQASRKW